MRVSSGSGRRGPLSVPSEPDRAKLKWHQIFIAIWHGTALKPVLMPFAHEGTKPVKENER